jgi:hypothetical protein
MRQNQRINCAMPAFVQLLGTLVANLFRPQRRLEVENLFLRHQLNIAKECTASSTATWE